ncbi:hypothetical protein Zmor_024255 [Zophobas morio]|uniref:Uncharacterized protein n=1 Tax=Zophobas morio TaxID=2755281 RepID=A0AA38I4U6_9CUCU|nr:hypothetical protein Zmor_024255 [Zophobas morio]
MFLEVFSCFAVLATATCHNCVSFQEEEFRLSQTNQQELQWTGRYNLTRITSCSSIKHREGKTYLEITNFLHGYIINMKNMHPRGQCRQECKDFTHVKTEKCFQNKWCKEQPPCSKIIKCEFKSAAMNVCRSNMRRTNRRYEYIDEPGIERNCTDTSVYLETQSRGLFDICDYCYCICEEDMPSADRYISLRTAVADVSDNRIVTGIRFIKNNGIIHFQVQDGKLMSYGKIDQSTVRWVPVRKFTVTDRNVHENVDYHKLTWQHRRVQLNDVFADEGFVITGVRFKQIGHHLRLNLEILTAPVNYAIGKLINPKNTSTYKGIPNIGLVNKFGKELRLSQPDVPSRDRKASIVSSTNKYVQFTTTDYYKDAGQTTVPFFDAKAAESRGSPLVGIGIFHRGVEESGGFIVPRIYALNLPKRKF